MHNIISKNNCEQQIKAGTGKLNKTPSRLPKRKSLATVAGQWASGGDSIKVLPWRRTKRVKHAREEEQAGQVTG